MASRSRWPPRRADETKARLVRIILRSNAAGILPPNDTIWRYVMLGSQNHRRMNATLALRLKIDDLHAHLAPLERYGLPGLSSSISDGVRALAGGFGKALRGFAACA